MTTNGKITGFGICIIGALLVINTLDPTTTQFSHTLSAPERHAAYLFCANVQWQILLVVNIWGVFILRFTGRKPAPRRRNWER